MLLDTADVYRPAWRHLFFLSGLEPTSIISSSWVTLKNTYLMLSKSAGIIFLLSTNPIEKAICSVCSKSGVTEVLGNDFTFINIYIPSYFYIFVTYF